MKPEEYDGILVGDTIDAPPRARPHARAIMHEPVTDNAARSRGREARSVTEPSVTDDEAHARACCARPVTAVACDLCNEPVPDDHAWRQFLRTKRGYRWAGWQTHTLCDACHEAKLPTGGLWTPSTRYLGQCRGGCGREILSLNNCNIVMAPYCSERCRLNVKNARARVARELEPRPCAECGAIFTPIRADGVFCKNACRQRAYRNRHRS